MEHNMATEMSEQIQKHIDAGEYVEALTALAHAWNERGEFGLRHCNLPGFEQVWVKFKTSGYPFSLRTKWDAAKTDVVTIGLILPYIVAWNVADVDGNPIGLPDGERTIELVNNVEDGLLMWLVREFTLFWFRELLQPRKNF